MGATQLTKCNSCRRPILFATVLRLDRSTETGVRVDAEPRPHGQLEYVRGTLKNPVLRELDDDERQLLSDGADRYMRHHDTAAPDPRALAAGTHR